MKLPKMPGTLAGLAMGAAVAAGGAMPVLGATVYDVNLDTTKTSYPENSFVQPRGNSISQYGDTVDLGAGAPTLLQNIVVPFVAAAYDDATVYAPTYTATNLVANVYSLDVNGLPDQLLGTATASNEFTTYEYTTSRPGVYAFTEEVTFDFSSQGIVLPDKFAFAVSDQTPLSGDPTVAAVQNSFSAWLDQIDSTDAFGSTQGSGSDSPRRYLEQQAGNWNLVAREIQNPSNEVEYNLVGEVNAIPVPEPASMLLLGAGGLLLLRRKRA
jgi:hypothetical protein